MSIPDSDHEALPILLAALLASGMHPGVALEHLDSLGYPDGAVLARLFPGGQPLLRSAAILAAMTANDHWAEYVPWGCVEHGVHPVSVAAQDPSLDSGQRSRLAAGLGASPAEMGWLTHESGSLCIRDARLERFPSGLAVAAGILVENVRGLEGVEPMPHGAKVTLRALDLTRIELLRPPVGGLDIRNCPELLEVDLPEARDLTLWENPVLRRLVIRGPIQGDLLIGRCPALEEVRLDGPVRGDLRLMELPSLRCIGGLWTVRGDLSLVDLAGLETIPDGLTCGGNFIGSGLGALTRLGRFAGPLKTFLMINVPRLRYLPVALEVRGVLSLDRCPELRRRPRDRYVERRLMISGCPHFWSWHRVMDSRL